MGPNPLYQCVQLLVLRLGEHDPVRSRPEYSVGQPAKELPRQAGIVGVQLEEPAQEILQLRFRQGCDRLLEASHESVSGVRLSRITLIYCACL